MKKIFLFLSILPMFLVAQEGDWFPIPSDQTAYYEYIGAYHLGNIKPYRIDSIINSPQGEIYYNIRTPEIFYYDFNEEGYLHDPQASWIGKKVLINQNEAFIYNKYDQPIYLPFQTPVGENWRMYNYEDGSYIEAWFSGEANQEIVEGITDDVKFLNFQIYNEEGNPLDSLMNSDTLILSKNYGFVKTFRWYQFPESYKLGKYLLTGMELGDEKYGLEWDYDELITSYEIGDIVHLHHDYFGSIAKEYMGKKIVGDTIEYEIKSTTPDYQSMTVDKVQYPLGIMPGQSMFNDSGEFIGYKTFDLQSSLWNRKKQYTVRDYFSFNKLEYNGQEYYYREMYSSVSDYPTQCFNDVHYYAKKCNADGDCWNIVYYKTQDEAWGVPISLKVADYQTVRPDMVTYFNNRRAIRIDSIQDFVFGKYYYSYHTLEMYDIFQEEANLYDFKTSWIGNKVSIINNGMNVFRDKYNRNYSIKTNADVKEKWTMIRFDNGNYIQATVIEKSYQMVMKSIYDSVKVIKCQAYSADGTPYNHPINNYDFRLSKNYGLLDMILFYHFFSWTAFEHPVAVLNGIKTPYFSIGNTDDQYNNSIASLEVGNKLHYRYYGSDYGFSFNREIISKNINGKQLEYGFRECKNTYGYGYDTTNTYEEIIGSKRFPINILPQEIVFDESIKGYPFSFAMWRFGETELCKNYDHFSYQFIEGGHLLEYQGQIFWKVWIDDAPHFAIARRWAKDIGWYIFDRGINSSGDYLDYLVTDQDICGSPHDFDCDGNVVGQVELNSDSKTTIFPNPSIGLFNIHSSKKIEEIKVYNLNAQIVLQVDKLEGTQIDLSTLPEGLYLLELITNDQELIHQKVVIEK